jgi:hypothetical protein
MTHLQPQILKFDLLYNVSFVPMSQTAGPIANCASLQLAVYVVFDAQSRYSKNWFYDARFMMMAANTCLLRETHITTLTVCTADMRLARSPAPPTGRSHKDCFQNGISRKQRETERNFDGTLNRNRDDRQLNGDIRLGLLRHPAAKITSDLFL